MPLAQHRLDAFAGMGNKQEDRFFRHFGLYGEASLDHSVEKAGFSRNDITDVFLTHLHFDHWEAQLDKCI